MKNIIKRTILLIVAAGLGAVPAVEAQKSTAKIAIYNKETGTQRAEASLYIRTDALKNEISQVVMGRGQVEAYKDVRYLNTSTLREEESLFRPLHSEAVYYNKKDQAIGGYEVRYNYDDKVVTYTEFAQHKKERLKKAFKIQGPICDAQNLALFLGRFLILHENLVYDHFYLLSTEPRLYKIHLYYRGTEEIEMDGRMVAARKVQLIGDMGPITQLAAKFLPKTFIWFTPKKPYQWLKYEGLESGPDSANIVIYNISN